MYLVASISLILAQNEEEYAEDAIEPVKQAPLPVRSSPFLKRGPSPRAVGKAAPTTTTTTTQKVIKNKSIWKWSTILLILQPEPAGEEEYDYEEGDGQGQGEVDTASTTTAKPSSRIGSGNLRPFRSNDDLLAALLKRRREQATFGK